MKHSGYCLKILKKAAFEGKYLTKCVTFTIDGCIIDTLKIQGRNIAYYRESNKRLIINTPYLKRYDFL